MDMKSIDVTKEYLDLKELVIWILENRLSTFMDAEISLETKKRIIRRYNISEDILYDL